MHPNHGNLPQPRAPQPSTHTTPLLRTVPRAAKSIPVPSPHLAAQEERETRKRGKKHNGTYSLGSRSAPRMTLASNAFPDADMHVNMKGKVVSGSSDSEAEEEASLLPSDEGVEVPSRQRNIASRTAQKTLPKSVRKRKLAIEDRPEEQPPLREEAHKGESIRASSEESDGPHSDVIELTASSSEEDIEKLLDAFDALTLSTFRLQQRR